MIFILNQMQATSNSEQQQKKMPGMTLKKNKQIELLKVAFEQLIVFSSLEALNTFTDGFQPGKGGASREACIKGYENNCFDYFQSLLDIDDVDRVMHFVGTLSWSNIAEFITRIETSAGNNTGWPKIRNMLIHVRLCVYLVYFEKLASENDYELLKVLVEKASQGDELARKLMNLPAIHVTWEDFKCRNWHDAQTVKDVENEYTGDDTAMIARITGMSRHQFRSAFRNNDGFSIFTDMIWKVQNLRASTMPDRIVEQKRQELLKRIKTKKSD